VNQAVKAAAIARMYLHEDGLEVVCIPEFTSVDIEGQERTAVRLVIEPR
jgi:stage V sporulation protein S